MDNLNSIQNISQIKLSNTKAEMVHKPLDNQNTPQKPQAQIQQQINQQSMQNISPSLMFDYNSIKMDNETILKYLQNLLKLPKTIDEFVNQLSSKQLNSKTVNLLIQNMISIKALSEFLNQNSNIAINKLLQTISDSLKQGVEDVTQLKDLLGILTTLQTNTNINSNSLRELMLLYIPLVQQVFDKEISIEEGLIEEKKGKNSKITILFETINFSNILCHLSEEENNLFIDIYTQSSFPKDKFTSMLKTLAKEIGVCPLIEFKNSKEKKDNTNSQNFKITSDEFVSSNMLIFSHLIIKLIFKIDNDFSLI